MPCTVRARLVETCASALLGRMSPSSPPIAATKAGRASPHVDIEIA
jgi:hypothetical protein